MGVSTDDLFGDAAGTLPAAPGSYGEPPPGYRLPADLRLGPVHLQVADVARSLAFYEGTLGLRVIERDGNRVALGADDGVPLVDLHARAGVREAPSRGRLGLFHFAILLPDRPSLGRFLRHLGDVRTRVGMADHLVSEAVYLQDPDNLGIEVYADRPRGAWRRMGRQLVMATDPLDVPDLIRAAADTRWSGMPAGTVMGHVHLHVGDIATGSAFYADALGFDRTVWQYPGALFFGAGGYHHRLATNTWAGRDATPPTEADARLLEWTMVLPDAAALEAVAESLARGGHPVERAEAAGAAPALVTRDPWGTPVRLTIP